MMMYSSTRKDGGKVPSARAIVSGLAPDGGLYSPLDIPSIDSEYILALADKPYHERAASVIGLFLTDFSYDELLGYAKAAYGGGKFSSPAVAPLHDLGEGVHVLELFLGPTSAFKDMALQILPHLLTASLKKTGEKREVCILVATSGDTGKAALEGFRDVPGTRILVFYPKEGVSEVQRLQMVTQQGQNVGVCAVNGNFDDAQTGVKQIFGDVDVAARLDHNGMFFSSANSINWGRLVPQIVYYISAYCDLVKNDAIKNGDKINICVPTGNFGNILAAYFAKCMGLPVAKLICASNSNNVLTELIKTGVYDRNRDFYTTISPSMDILISSNVERLLYELTGHDAGAVADYMSSLSKTGRYELREAEKAALATNFTAGFCNEAATKATIKSVYEKSGYLLDPHTAVGIKVLEEYQAATGDLTPAVAVATASPYKFCDSVLSALDGREREGSPALLAELAALTGTTPPAPLSSLSGMKPRFDGCVDGDKRNMAQAVYSLLGI